MVLAEEICEELTKRDIKVLKFISITGTATTKQIQKIFQSSWYHYKRLKVLETKGYIRRDGTYLHLTKKGRQVVGCTEPWVRKDWQKEWGTKINDIILEVSDSFTFLSSRETKAQYGLNRASKLNGLLTNGVKNYVIYLLHANPHAQRVQAIKREITKHVAATNLQRVIVFASSPKAMKKFGDNDCGAYELLLLPYPAGARLLSDMSNPEVDEYIRNLLPGAVPVSAPFADYLAGDTYISVLVLNDLVRRARLKDYFSWDLEKKPVLIVCLQDQLNLLKNLYPDAEFAVLPNRFLVKYSDLE